MRFIASVMTYTFSSCPHTGYNHSHHVTTLCGMEWTIRQIYHHTSGGKIESSSIYYHFPSPNSMQVHWYIKLFSTSKLLLLKLPLFLQPSFLFKIVLFIWARWLQRLSCQRNPLTVSSSRHGFFNSFSSGWGQYFQ